LLPLLHNRVWRLQTPLANLSPSAQIIWLDNALDNPAPRPDLAL